MSDRTTYLQRNRKKNLDRAKEYYKSSKQVLNRKQEIK